MFKVNGQRCGVFRLARSPIDCRHSESDTLTALEPAQQDAMGRRGGRLIEAGDVPPDHKFSGRMSGLRIRRRRRLAASSSLSSSALLALRRLLLAAEDGIHRDHGNQSGGHCDQKSSGGSHDADFTPGPTPLSPFYWDTVSFMLV